MDNQNMSDVDVFGVIFGTRKAWKKFLGPEAFWGYVDKTDACWLWEGTHNRQGYGVYHDGKKPWLAHRYAYTMTSGPIPAGLVLLHSCDNPSCVNPAHLTPGTQAENMADMRTKGRRVKRFRCRAVQVPGERRPRSIVRVLMEEKDLDVEDVVRQLNIAYPTFWKLRNKPGQRIAVPLLGRLAKALGVPAHDLIEVDPPAFQERRTRSNR